jgi:hypothetical protein|tara:strand:- start:30 stop:224 length:195 start_codon:yes stop_codon:yes gene_type:complete
MSWSLWLLIALDAFLTIGWGAVSYVLGYRQAIKDWGYGYRQIPVEKKSAMYSLLELIKRRVEDD